MKTLLSLVLTAFAILCYPVFADEKESGENAAQNAFKDEKLVAELKKNVEIEWDQWPGKKPAMKIKITLQGKAASLASACGELKIEEFVNENGNKLEPDEDDSLENEIDEASHIRGVNDVFGSGTGLVLKIKTPPEFKAIKSLKGTLALQTGGVEQKVTVKNPLESLDCEIDNEALSALGISLSIKRKISETKQKPGVFASADEIQLNAKWQKTPIVRCEFYNKIWQIEAWMKSPGWSSDPHQFLYNLGYQKKLPDGAELRLTVHQDRRKVLVPFEFKDIEVPPVPKIAWSSSVEEEKKDVDKAEELRPDDPLLADMNVTAKAEWCLGFSTNNSKKQPPLRIKFEMTGRAASLASQKSEVAITSITDENGQPVALKKSDEDCNFHVIARSIGNQTKDGIEFLHDFKKAPPVKNISELRGSIDLRTDGKIEIITLKDFPKEQGDKITDESLKSLGITIEAERKKKSETNFLGSNMRDELAVRADFGKSPIIDCEIIDAKEKPIKTISACSCGQENSCSYSLGYMRKLPPDAKIRITYHKDGRKVRVPLVCKDIEIPPIPEKTEARTSLFPEPKIPAGTHPLRVIFADHMLTNTLRYLTSDVVRKELDLSDEQRRELDELIALDHSISTYFDANPDLTDSEKSKKITEVCDQCVPRLEKLLPPERMDRLCEMIMQIEGPQDFLCDIDRNRIKKLFDLTSKQMKEFENAVTAAQESMSDLCPSTDSDSNKEKKTREQQLEVEKKYRAIEKELSEKILKIFTPQQLEKYDQLQGKKIDVEKAIEEMEKSA
jgi:hypothetical protein